MWKKVSLVLLFVVYAVILTLVLLVVRFPQDKFLEYGAALLEKALPGSRCSIADADYLYPLSLKLQGIRIDNAVAGVDLMIDEGELRFDTKQPMSRFFTRFQVLGSDVESEVLLHRGQGALQLPALSIQGVDLAVLTSLGQRLDRSIDGIIGFSGTYLAPLASPSVGALSGTLRADDLRFVLRRPILQENEVQLETVTADIVASGGTITLSLGAAVGPVYEGRFSGEVRSTGVWWQSEIELEGDFLPRQEYLSRNRQLARAVTLLNNSYGSGPIPYTVSGTLVEPEFNFGTSQSP